MNNNYQLKFICFWGAILIYSIARPQTTPVLWGVTHAGGNDTARGTIFSIHGDGSGFTNEVNFDQGVPGASPNYVQLAPGSSGNYYGTTTQGGTYGEGIIFSVNPSGGTYNALYNFNDTLGGFPYGGLIQATDGKLYGMTNAGGANGYGILFSFNPSNNGFQDVFDFDSTHGSFSYGALLEAANGKLYGLTSAGGTYDYGVLFSYNLSSSAYTDLYDFNYADGATPYGGLIQTADGYLYGMASQGGDSVNLGCIFRFDTSTNTYTDLFNFYDTVTSGANPYGNLTSGPDNLLYGMTAYGGNTYHGVIFSFNPAGSIYSTLYIFNDTLGGVPHGNLTFAADSNFYGVTAYGGILGLGNVFRYNPQSGVYADIFDFDSTTGFIPYGSLTIQDYVTGILQPQTGNLDMKLYPNPSCNFTMVSVGEPGLGGTLTLTDVSGRQLMSSRVISLNNSIPLDNLSSGTYYLTLRKGEYSATQVLIKE